MESNPSKTIVSIKNNNKVVKNTSNKDIKYKIIKRNKEQDKNNINLENRQQEAQEYLNKINNNLDKSKEKNANIKEKLINKDINQLYNVFCNKIQDNNIINAFNKVLFGRITQISNNTDYYKIKCTDNKNKIVLYYYIRGLLLILHKTLLNYIEFNQEDRAKFLMFLENLKENYCNNAENNNKNKINKLCLKQLACATCSLCNNNILEQPI